MDADGIVAGRFALGDRRGVGGMGAVYRARDQLTGRDVAVKVLHDDGTDPSRFAHEADVLAELDHDAIVRYVAHGRDGAGYFLAMEWLDGEDLGERLDREPLLPADAVAMVARIADGLGVAHRRGIVHRDVKPSNVFLVDGDPAAAKLLDFGVARSDRRDRAHTRTGTAIGTPGYMAPEQARGDRDIDARVDVFALGAVLFRCLAGTPPFDASNTIASLTRVLFEEPPRLAQARPDLPAALDDLLARALAKDRAARFADGAALAIALRAVIPALASASPPILGASGITGGEHRIVSSVLVRHPEWAADGDAGPSRLDPTHTGIRAETPTVAVGEEVGANAAMRLAIPLRGSFERLADGSWAIVFGGAGNAKEMAVRAARFARALLDRMPGSRIVITTGRTHAGATAGSDAAGDAYGRAGRMLERAEAGDVLVDDITAGLLDDRAVVERDDARGVTRLRGARTARRAGARPLVGRGKELRMLRGLVDATLEEGQPGAALLVAPAGAGKSRVAAEVIAEVERDELAAVWRAGADPLGQAAPFALLGHLLAAAVDAGARPPAEAREVIAAADPLAPASGADVMARGDALRRAVEDWLAGAAQATPLVIVLDDVHWADPPTLTLLDGVLRNVAAPIFVLALARPEVHDRFPRLWADRGATTLHLGPLPAASAAQLARAALGPDARDDVVAAVVERAGGNPFFVEELAKVRASAGTGEWPGTVLATVEARLANLDVDARRVLRAAAVLGATFWESGVAHLLGGSAFAGVVASRLAVLIEREFVVAQADSRLAGERQLAFRHALVRDAAYGTLTDADRRLAHRLAAEWLERRGEAGAVIAEHFARAGQASRAVGHWAHAAEAALVGNDVAGAVALVERAIASGVDARDLGILRSLEAEASWWRGEHARAEQAGVEALGLLRTATRRWYAALGATAWAAGARGNVPLLIELTERLVAAPTHGDRSSDVIAAVKLINFLLFAGETSWLDRLMFRVKGHLPHLPPDSRAWGWVEYMRYLVATRDGDLGRAIHAVRASLAGYEVSGDRRNAALQRLHHGFCLTLLGQLDDAEAELRRSIADAERLGAAYTAAGARLRLGYCLALQGRRGEAEAVLRASRDALRGHGDPRAEERALAYLADAIAAARPADAEALLREALALADGHPPLRAAVAAQLARHLLRAGGAHVEAVELARDAHDRLDDGEIIEEGEATIRLAWAEALEADGRVADAAAVAWVAAQRLRTRARRLGSAAWSDSFLARIPENAATLAVAARLGA